MASFGFQLSFFLLFVLVLSPQIQAREGKVFSLFTHFRTTYNVKDHQVLPVKPKAKSPAPITAPTPAPITAPTPEPIAAPTPEPITAPTPAPITAPTPGSVIESGPAPEPDFVDMGNNGYGLYGTESSSQYSSPTKETPTTTTFQNKLLDEEFTGESYKTTYPKTSSNNNYNYNPSSNYNNEVYRNNYNNEEYRSSYNNGYNKKYADSYSNNNYNERYSNNYNERFSNNYNGNEYNNNNNKNYNGNGYEVKREGMSDTRFMENGRYYYPVKTENENYKLNEYQSVRGNTNEGYYEKTQYPNEFDTMEEYEKQQASQGYTP